MKRVTSLKSIKTRRNQKLRKYFAQLQHKQPNWRYNAWVGDTAEKFYISPRTVKAVLNRETGYED